MAGCEAARFEKAFRQDNIEGYKEFNSQYPRSEYSPIVTERIQELEEENLYFEVTNKGTSEAFRFFLEKFPSGKHAKEIRDKRIISEVKSIAKSHELSMAGAGGEELELKVKNKTGVAVRLFVMSRLMSEAELQPGEEKKILSRGYALLACKTEEGVVLPGSHTVAPAQDQVAVEIWLSTAINNIKSIVFYEED